MAALSLCMIVKDEGKFLGDCLSAINPYADEIIVIDTGSKDNTKEIAESFGAKVYDFDWCDDFSAARNFSLSKAAKDWVLVLDADETISSSDMEKIKHLLDDGPADSYVFTQRNYTYDRSMLGFVPCHKESRHTKDFLGYETSKLVRLFRNNKGFEFRSRVHELIEPSIKERGGIVRDSGINIHHYRECKSKVFEEEKRKRYFELGEKQIKDKPDDEKAYYETGLILLKWKEYGKAIGRFRKVMEISPGYKKVRYNLGLAYYRMGELDKAEEILKECIVEKPKLDAAYNILGLIYQKRREFDKAIDILMKGINHCRSGSLVQSLGSLYVRIGVFDEALKAFRIVLKSSPDDIGVLNNLSGAYVGLKEYDEAIKILERIISKDERNINVYTNMAFVYLKKGDKERASGILNKAIEKFPEKESELRRMLETI